jgi:hypothetical protein
VAAHPADGDDVQGAVELPVAEAVEAMATSVSAVARWPSWTRVWCITRVSWSRAASEHGKRSGSTASHPQHAAGITVWLPPGGSGTIPV